VIRSTRDFWVFHAVFWLLAGMALFLYGLTYGHMQVALVRNIYNPIVGLACSYLIRAVYDGWYPAGFVGRLLLIAGLSLIAGLISALVVNPITFGLLGYKLVELPLHTLLKDGLYFVLLYILWSLLYLQLTGKPLTSAPAAAAKPGFINVTKGNRVFKLDPANISCIKASGDYVELVTGAESYLKQGTISFYEQALGPGTFFRIHRSIIVNSDKIAAISGPTKGQYWIVMQDGQELRSSRRYREVVESLLPEAP
jgi:two-component system LytT family response regulator